MDFSSHTLLEAECSSNLGSAAGILIVTLELDLLTMIGSSPLAVKTRGLIISYFPAKHKFLFIYKETIPTVIFVFNRMDLTLTCQMLNS